MAALVVTLRCCIEDRNSPAAKHLSRRVFSFGRQESGVHTAADGTSVMPITDPLLV